MSRGDTPTSSVFLIYACVMTTRSYALPVSVKGIVFDDKRVWLRHNERDEWELPGGKVDPGEQPTETVERELHEELGLTTRADTLVQAHIHTIPGSVDESGGVLVLTYLCEPIDADGGFEENGEAGVAHFQQFALNQISTLNMPGFYKDAIDAAWEASSTEIRNYRPSALRQAAIVCL